MTGTLCYANHVKHLDSQIYFPVDELAAKYSKEYLKPIIDRSPLKETEEKEIQQRGPGDNRSKRTENKYEKHYGGNSISLAGSRSHTSTLMSTCQILMVDEVDSCHLVSGNADFHTEVTRATRGQPHARNIFGGTPSERVGESFIVRSFEESAYKFEYHVPCPHCGTFQTLKFRGQSADRRNGFVWEGKGDANTLSEMDERASTVRYIGLCCGKPWTWEDYRSVTNEGEWRTEKGERLDCSGRLPRVYDEKGKRLPMKSDIAFSIWAGYSYYHDWKEMVKDWLIANGPRGDVMKLATFVRTYLGEEFHDRRKELESEEVAARHSYAKAPEWVETITAGADVQIDKVVFGVWGYGHKEERHCWLAAKEFHGKDTRDERDASWMEAALWINSNPKWETSDGRELPIKCLNIDKRYQEKQVRTFLRNINRPAIRHPIYGDDLPSISIKVKGEMPFTFDKRRQGGHRPAKIAVHRLKLGLMDKLLQDRETLQFTYLNTMEAGLDHRKFDELTSETLEAEGKGVRSRYVFRKKNDRIPNEQWDCAVYAYAGLHMLNPSWWRVTKREVRAYEVKKRQDTAAVSGGLMHELSQKKTTKAQLKTRRKHHQTASEKADVVDYIGADRSKFALSKLADKLREMREMTQDAPETQPEQKQEKPPKEEPEEEKTVKTPLDKPEEDGNLGTSKGAGTSRVTLQHLGFGIKV